ncbi:hypothetical protein WJX81_004219 [Elliptochloris bilobata]|uniref:SDR family NAD(P)-dependent oxidoreductase n=1 Tax=Elliptochloris bilobata TaxID=381761 RepID=A0AAW1SDV5_9CHLO
MRRHLHLFARAAGISAYCASKFAVRGFMDSLRLELLGTGVTLHMACPGFVDTPMIREAQKAASDNVKRLKASFVPTMMTAEQVADHTVRGLARGSYIIGSPDRGANMIVGSSLAAVSARFYPGGMKLD